MSVFTSSLRFPAFLFVHVDDNPQFAVVVVQGPSKLVTIEDPASGTIESFLDGTRLPDGFDQAALFGAIVDQDLCCFSLAILLDLTIEYHAYIVLVHGLARISRDIEGVQLERHVFANFRRLNRTRGEEYGTAFDGRERMDAVDILGSLGDLPCLGVTVTVITRRRRGW